MARPRLARPDEAGAVKALVEAAYAQWVPVIGRRPAPMDDDYAALIAAGEVTVSEGESGLLGVLVLEEREGRFWLENIAVSPAAAGTGLGRRLLDVAEEEARRRGHGEIWLFTNALMAKNVEIYTRRGYAVVERRQEKGFDRFYMSKALV
ncbi:GNAT family N-acetyltransferase [Acetobacteraceae bacterium H6797]|nr:GNAT family N-acetyltransferase [Acetobacteraceae bacterium H6797]